MSGFVRFDPDIKRLRTFVDRTHGIQFYTKNNLYPQIVEAIRDRSYTVSAACDKLGDFIAGQGFKDPNIANLVVNSKGKTMNEILRALKIDAATFRGSFVVHLGTNMLGQYNNISVWPLAYWRLGLPDENGDVHDLKYSSNWENDPYKEQSPQMKIIEYPVYNPEKLQDQIEEAGLGYSGQVLYVSPLEDQYPLATFDSVLDQAQTQEEIGIYRLSSIQNGLNASYIFSYPGKFENQQKVEEFKQSLDPFKGGKGAGSAIVIEDESGLRKAQDLITPLTLQNADRIHEFISSDDKKAIVEAFAMPKGILGILPDTGMFNQQQIMEEYFYYNAQTKPLRTSVSEAFKKIFANWYQPIQSDFEITPLTYGI